MSEKRDQSKGQGERGFAAMDDVNLGSIITRGPLRDGIAYALRQ